MPMSKRSRRKQATIERANLPQQGGNVISPEFCPACGELIVQRYGSTDFCSKDCCRAGRSFCKQCQKPLPRSERGGYSQAFCNNLCRKAHRRYIYNIEVLKKPFVPTPATNCKACGAPLEQDKDKGGRRLYCSPRCGRRYRSTGNYQYSITDDWGSYAPEVRKILRELEEQGMWATALHLASAIDHEYRLRHNRDPQIKHITYTCKTCGKEFKRKRNTAANKDYCSLTCNPNMGSFRDRDHYIKAPLTWEQVDEIRELYKSEGMSYQSIAKRYGVSGSTVSHIVNYRAWKPEHDPRRLGQENYLRTRGRGENNKNSKLTWEQVDEIRKFRETQSLSYTEIAERYGIHPSTIRYIVKYKIWKPEYDPRQVEPITSKQIHSFRAMHDQTGENSAQAKLTWEQVDEIRSIAGIKGLSCREM